LDAAPDDPPDAQDRTDSPARGRHGGPPSRLALWAVIVPLVIMVIGGYVSTIMLSSWVKEHPLWLVGLSASNRNLVLVSDNTAALPYYLVGTLRLFAPDPLFYLLGWWYGDAAVRWMECKSPTYGSLFRSLERGFGKFGYPLVFIAPNNPICLFAGAAAMPVAPFVVVNIAGTVTRLVLIRLVGGFFSDPLTDIRNWLSTYRIPVLIVSALLVGLTIWAEQRKGKGQVEELINLEEELEGEVPD
jgi:membrane protein DedA with SNARE-associated domain